MAPTLSEMTTMNNPSTEFPITLTPKANQVALDALTQTKGEDGNILRVSVVGGGCSGLKYSLNFVDKTGSYDVVDNLNGLQVTIDIFSALHLKGATVDYVESAEASGFQFSNPNAQTTCGCGSSFS